MSRERIMGEAALRWALDHPDPGLTLYSGSAGLLVALAEAHLGGLTHLDAKAAAIRDQLIAGITGGAGFAAGTAPEDPFGGGLYEGVVGLADALLLWAGVAGDPVAAGGAQRALGLLVDALAVGDLPPAHDVIEGSAGWLLALMHATPLPRQTVEKLADGLLAVARPAGAGLDWPRSRDRTEVYPGFSHGTAGVGFALARAGARLGREDLLAAARAGAARLLEIGRRPDGTVAPPLRLPEQAGDTPSYGWCHGPTGTLRLFSLLDRLEPGTGWGAAAQGCRRAVRGSGLPARLWPGFWDNVGQCCGTAGVGEMALDSYQGSGDLAWLRWSEVLAAEVMDRAIVDPDGARWSNVEHRRVPASLPPESGWAMGAAGVGMWLLRLDRVRREGADATALVRVDGLPPV